jgi:hypothetical protein
MSAGSLHFLSVKKKELQVPEIEIVLEKQRAAAL